jgi:hypothetical protein
VARITGRIAALVLGLVLSGASVAQSYLPGPHTMPPSAAENLAVLHWTAWSAACDLKKVDCRKWPMPVVVYGLLPGSYGRYRFGSDIVQIDLRLMGGEFAQTVIIHEMIHYIQDLQRPLRPDLLTAEQACHDEEEAYRLVYAYVLVTGTAIKDFRVKQWDVAKFAYPHCFKLEK